jgi:hypothetical protein
MIENKLMLFKKWHKVTKKLAQWKKNRKPSLRALDQNDNVAFLTLV